MKYGPFPIMLTTSGHMFPHMELTWRPCTMYGLSRDDYLFENINMYLPY